MQASTSATPTFRHTHKPEDSGASQRPGVMARLHGLFPAASHEAQADGDGPKARGSQRMQKSKPAPRYLKIRMLTWNMHDSVPKGNLQDLLGVVHDDASANIIPGELPEFSLDTSHPYHLVVVAGQECPSLSGIPMGLGAGFKLKDKEREKLRDKDPHQDREWSERLQPLSRHSEQSKDEDEERARRRSRHRSLIRHHSSQRHSHEDISSTNPEASSQDKHQSAHHQPSGWTYMLEGWYCNGGPSLTSGPASSAHTPLGGHETGYLDDGAAALSHKARSTGELNARLNALQKGPYEMLVKERMMGLYLAVFVHRDVKDLVEKTSRSAVTAGLIGGRVGNKGGLGISLKVAGTSLLFINAHLAAHEGKVQHRIANFVKIKNELSVDDFLAADDPRIVKEDLTDRFDFAFVCGDLNFRLDVTRLHADWLISRKEYGQALAFDQLRNVMQTNPAFAGFEEGPIDFPPTFKYDVLKYRRTKRASKRISRNPLEHDQLHEKLLTEIEEKVQEHAADDTDEEPEADGEALSFASTAWTSNTRYTVDGDDPELEGEDYFLNNPYRINASTGHLVTEAKVLSSTAVHKAKAKWMSLVAKPHSPLRKWHKAKQGQNHKRPQTPSSPSLPPPSPSLPSPRLPHFIAVTLPPTPSQDDVATASVQANDNLLKPNRSVGSSEHSPSSTPAIANSVPARMNQSNDKSGDEEEKGVYDSSHKQRVPSWCDRILWKSNLLPDSESDTDDDDTVAYPLPHRSRMGSLFHALRPASIRARKDSTASADAAVPAVRLVEDSLSTSPISPTGALDYSNHDLPSPPHSSPPHQGFTSPAALRHSKSSDYLHSRDRPLPYRTRTQLPPHEGNRPRSRRVSLNSLNNHKPSAPSAPQTHPQSDSLTPPPVPHKEFIPPPAPVASLWKSLHFFPFLRDVTTQSIPPENPYIADAPPAPPPRKGDVVCLGYDTLDDKQMRRLEGRSDHRPVIGSYALYI